MIMLPKLMRAIDSTSESIHMLEEFEHINEPLLGEFRTFFRITHPTSDWVYKEGEAYLEQWHIFLKAFRRQAVITLRFRAAYKHEDRNDVIEFLKELTMDDDQVVRERAQKAIKDVQDAIKYKP